MLFRIAGLPVTFPLWVVHKVMQEAENEFYDERSIVSALAQLSQLHDQGEISADAFERDKAILVERLKEARARQQPDQQR